jgi:hypothetical protein
LKKKKKRGKKVKDDAQETSTKLRVNIVRNDASMTADRQHWLLPTTESSSRVIRPFTELELPRTQDSNTEETNPKHDQTGDGDDTVSVHSFSFQECKSGS